MRTIYHEWGPSVIATCNVSGSIFTDMIITGSMTNNHTSSDYFPYRIESYPVDALEALRNDPAVFAIINHGNKSHIGQSDNQLEIELSLPPLNLPKIEAWRSSEQLNSGIFKQIRYKHSETFLFGCLYLDEADYSDLASATILAYQQIHDALENTSFPALLRMWNFFPQINIDSQGLERYRSFCLGRHKALDEWHFTEELLPAASAIGSHSDGLIIYFLAARQPGIQIENPRQVSAFHYPKQYGPRSPSFSRGTLKNWGKSQHLYISGTASIVGHETKHHNDVAAQLEETLTNIRLVIDQARSRLCIACTDITGLDAMRIYIRNPGDAELIISNLKNELSNSDCQLTFVHGDVCRSDLLLEIEGHYIS